MRWWNKLIEVMEEVDGKGKRGKLSREGIVTCGLQFGERLVEFNERST